jgi:hypothetical protein
VQNRVDGPLDEGLDHGLAREHQAQVDRAEHRLDDLGRLGPGLDLAPGNSALAAVAALLYLRLTG